MKYSKYIIAFTYIIIVMTYFTLLACGFLDDVDERLSTILSFSLFSLSLYLFNKYKPIIYEFNKNIIKNIEKFMPDFNYYEKYKIFCNNIYLRYFISYMSIVIVVSYIILLIIGFFDKINDVLSIIIFLLIVGIFGDLYHKCRLKK